MNVFGMSEREAEEEIRKVSREYEKTRVPEATSFLGYDRLSTMFSPVSNLSRLI